VTIVTTDAPRRIHCESFLEAKVAYVLLARPDIVDVTEQPPPVPYQDEAGRTRTHFFDFRVTRSDGTRVAIAVKPAKVVRRRKLRELLHRIAAAMPPSYADAVLLVTEEDLSLALVHNAMLIHSVRRGRCADHDARVAALVRTLNGRVTVGTLVEVLGLAGDGFRAVVRAIADGTLTVRGRGRIAYDSWVAPASLAAADGEAT